MFFEDSWSIGEKIKKHRMIRGVSQAELAKRVGVPYQNITSFENGVRVPKVEIREEIAHELHTDVLELTGVTLSKEEEIRILNKLLVKYAQEMSVDSSGSISVKLDTRFNSLSEKFNEYKNEIKAIDSNGDSCLQDFKDHCRALHEGEMPLHYLTDCKEYEDSLIDISFWLDSWPEYDVDYQYENTSNDQYSKKALKVDLQSKYYAKLKEYSANMMALKQVDTSQLLTYIRNCHAHMMPKEEIILGLFNEYGIPKQVALKQVNDWLRNNRESEQKEGENE